MPDSDSLVGFGHKARDVSKSFEEKETDVFRECAKNLTRSTRPLPGLYGKRLERYFWHCNFFANENKLGKIK